MNELYIATVKEYNTNDGEDKGLFTIYLNTDEHSYEEMVKGTYKCLRGLWYKNPYFEFKKILEINPDYSFLDGKKCNIEYFKFLRSLFYFNKKTRRWEIKNFPYPYLSILNLIMPELQYNIFWVGKNENSELIKEIGKQIHFTDNIEVTYFSEDTFKNDIESLIEIFRIEKTKFKKYSIIFSNNTPFYYIENIVERLQILNKEYRTPSCYYYSEKEFKTDGKILYLNKDSRNKIIACEANNLFI